MIKAEDQDIEMEKAPKKRSWASKTPQPNTLPGRHAIPMSEPKPERASKDKAEKKRTRASESHVTLPRRQPAPSPSLSSPHESGSKETSPAAPGPTPQVNAALHRPLAVPMSEPKPKRTVKAKVRPAQVEESDAPRRQPVLSPSLFSLDVSDSDKTSRAAPGQTPQADTVLRCQPVFVSEPKPLPTANVKATAKPARVSESDIPHRHPALSSLHNTEPSETSKEFSRTASTPGSDNVLLPNPALKSKRKSKPRPVAKVNDAKKPSRSSLAPPPSVPSLHDGETNEMSKDSSHTTDTPSSDTVLRLQPVAKPKRKSKPWPAAKVDDPKTSSRPTASDDNCCSDCESEEAYQRRVPNPPYGAPPVEALKKQTQENSGLVHAFVLLLNLNLHLVNLGFSLYIHRLSSVR